ncbi:hypothetical protein PIB30_065694 [Stylosanthes scabra]|uniref:Uncharacterized protein n=1 Tax=Stylosanthes scabra TaxID=79078 RepID=A0ABU6TLU0_9FABA|nr:hypothetical protein [Stylosanthes scabra]
MGNLWGMENLRGMRTGTKISRWRGMGWGREVERYPSPQPRPFDTPMVREGVAIRGKMRKGQGGDDVASWRRKSCVCLWWSSVVTPLDWRKERREAATLLLGKAPCSLPLEYELDSNSGELVVKEEEGGTEFGGEEARFWKKKEEDGKRDNVFEV